MSTKLLGMNLNSSGCYVYFSLLCCALGFSQEPPQEQQDSLSPQTLDEVVITATRTLRQLSSLPLPVTLISKAQVEQTGVARLDEILGEQTGIVVTPDATIGGGAGVQIQGVGADYVLILIDGVPVVGRSGGNLDLSRLAVGNIEQVEVVKGPSSSLYGSEALGGVINIITKKPTSEQITGQVAHRVATFNNNNTTVSVNQQGKRWGYALFGDYLSTDGFDLAPSQQGQTNAPFYNYTLNGRLFFEASKKLNLFASARYFLREFDVSPGISEERDGNLLLRATHDPSLKSNFEYELYYTNYITDEKTIDATDEDLFTENDFNQKLLRPEVRFNYSFSLQNVLTLGSGYTFETLQRSLFADDVSFDAQYIFGQYDFKPLEKLNVIVGARFDNHSEYQSQLSPKLSARLELSPTLALKGSVGTGFKAPDFRQLYLNFTNAQGGNYTVLGKEVEAEGIEQLLNNGETTEELLRVDRSELGEPLKAESSVGYNLGLAYTKGKVSAEINAFRNDFTDFIDTRLLATKTDGANVFGYINRESVYTQGLEVDLRYTPWNNLSLSAGYQLLYAFDKDDKEVAADGDIFVRDPETGLSVRVSESDYFGLENRSRHTLNIKAFYEIPKWQANANLRVNYRSRFGLIDTNGNDLLDSYDASFVEGYALVNFALSKTFYKHYQLQAGVNNLFDFKGEDPIASQNSTVFINPGIQFFTRLNVQF